jgi:peptide/nickel transport system substrate-binding protein
MHITGHHALRRALTTAGTVLVVAGMLAGCSTATEATSSSAKSASPGSVLNVALPGTLSNLYAGQEAGVLNYYVESLTQEGLVSVSADGKLEPGLATSWLEPDPETYIFTVRSDAKFQDGTPVTVNDIIFSINEAKDATASPNFSSLLSDISSVSQTGTHQLTIKLSAPNVSFLWAMSPAGELFVTSQAFWQANKGQVGTSKSLLLGSGPYKVTSYVPDSHVDFERVDSWWGGVPKIKKINIQFIPDNNTRLLARESGSIDMAFNVPLTQASQWEKASNTKVLFAPDRSFVGLTFDTQVAPFNDVHVRKAIAESIDRPAVVSKLLDGHGQVATSFATPQQLSPTYNATKATEKLASVAQLPFSLKDAKKELAESSVPHGFTTTLVYPSSGPQLGDAAQSLAQNLAKIGITLNVKEEPVDQWITTLGVSKYPLGFMWYFSTTGDPGELENWLLGAGNPAGYTNQKMTDILTQAANQTNPSDRIGELVKANQLEAKDVAYYPLWWGQSATAFASNLGIRKNSSFAFISAWPTQLYRTK